jgi:hypothetical protein
MHHGGCLAVTHKQYGLLFLPSDGSNIPRNIDASAGTRLTGILSTLTGWFVELSRV